MTSTDLVNELQAQLTSDTLLIILVDSSESVAASYPTIVTGILPLILEKTPGMIRSIIEFGTAVKTVCAFTKNSTVLMNAVKGTNVMIPHPKFPHDRSKDVKRNPGMTHMGGGSNLAEGLTTCMWALLGSDMPKTAIILITNGEPSSDISKAYRSLMDLRPVLIAVGVGHGVEEHKFASLLPDAHRFLSRDYTGLLSTLQALRPIMPKFEITCRQIGTTLQNTTDPVVLEVVISPLLINGVVPAGTVLHFLPGFYLDEVVKTTADAYRERPFETTVTLKPGRWASYKGLVPEKVRYECFMDGTKYTGYVPLLLAWFGAEWLPERRGFPNPTEISINILVWGWYGSGKSAFCNGLATSFSSGQDVLAPLQAFSMPGHVTGNYTEHPLAELLPGNCPTDEMMRRLNLRFWDPWGISDSNYKKVSVVDFLNGKVRPGTPMEDSFDIIVEPDKSRIIHSVIVIVPIGTAANPQSLEILGTHVKAIIRAGRQPIVVCNFINSVSDENEVEEKAKKIRTAMYLPERSVIKFDNYVEEKTRNMEKDLQYWRILRLAYMNAITYLLSHPRECYLEGTPTTATATTIPAYSPPDRSAPTTATLAVLLDQVEVVDGSNARVTSNLWGIPNNKKLSAVRSDVDETGEFKGISPWVFVDAADVPVPTTKEAELTLRQILRSGDTLSIRVQMSTKPKAVSCSLGVYQAKPKSSSTPEYLYDIEVPENFLDRSVEWLTQQLGADILVRSRVAKVAPPARPKVALRSVVDVIDGKTVVYVAG